MKLRFPKRAETFFRGLDHLLVVLPSEACTADVVECCVPDELSGLVLGLAAEVEPGLLGDTATSLAPREAGTGSKKGSNAKGGAKGGAGLRVTVGVLPDTGTRYNTPSRAEAVRTVVAAANLAATLAGGKSVVGVLLVLDGADHALAAANNVVRALPMLTLKSSGRGLVDNLAIYAVDRQGVGITLDSAVQQTLNSSRNAARLVDTPPTDLDPAALAKEARAWLRGTGVQFEEIIGSKLLEHGLGGIHAVGRCARSAPRMLVGRYRPAKKKGKGSGGGKRSSGAPPHVALVGKGVTYDTGGLHLKGRGGMEGMKGDMGGAAAVLGAFEVLVKEDYRGPVTMVLCLVENAIGPDAYKPDDVLTMHSGKTVEVNNTDAEGRVVLADGVSWAAREAKADVILDAATLTGAQMVATGTLHSSCFSNDAELERILVEAGFACGDMTHPMPFAPEFYKSEFKSPLADMRNSVASRSNAQVSCAAQFIYWHIEDTEARWGHIDLAGPAKRGDRGTGYGVALLAEAVRRLGAG